MKIVIMIINVGAKVIQNVYNREFKSKLFIAFFIFIFHDQCMVWRQFFFLRGS